MNAIQELVAGIVRKVQHNEKVSELEWVLDIAYKDTGIDKGTLSKAAVELAALRAELETTQHEKDEAQKTIELLRTQIASLWEKMGERKAELAAALKRGQA